MQQLALPSFPRRIHIMKALLVNAHSQYRAIGVGVIVLAIGFTTMAANAQTSTCGSAVSQLQNYVAQVNAFASSEYNQGIPMRCGGNPNCMQWWLGQLNGWYMQQTNLVNGWYGQLTQQCTHQSGAPGRIRNRRPSNDDPGEIDESSIEDIRVDDEDKTVRIRIPSSPKGFR